MRRGLKDWDVSGAFNSRAVVVVVVMFIFISSKERVSASEVEFIPSLLLVVV